MALTSTQLTQLRYYLGYPEVDRTVDTEAAKLSAEGEAQVVAQLGRLSTLESTYDDVAGRGGLVRAEGLEWVDLGDQLEGLATQGRRLAAALARYLDVPLGRTPFDAVGQSGRCGRG